MNKNSKIWTIISHEYISKITSKGFIIGTLVAPLAIILIYGVIIAVTILTHDQTALKFAILDKTGEVGKELVDRDTSKFYLVSESADVLKKKVLDEELDGFVLIPESFLHDAKIEVFTRGGGGTGFTNLIEKNSYDILLDRKMKEANASPDLVNLVEKGVVVETKKVTEEGSKDDYSQIFAFLGYFMGFVIYGLMFTYGAFVMRGVIEEKANRIVEVIASSVKPFDIMFGKVVGIGAVGLTQVLFWLLILVILFAVGGTIAAQFISPQEISQQAMAASPQMQQMSDQNEMLNLIQNFSISPWLIVAFLFYFLAGYFIYSSLFAAVGSAVDQEQDAAQLQLPVSLPIIIPIMFISSVMADPNGTLATVLSLIPFFSPILMIARIAAAEVPIWQIALSVVLLTITFFACLWFAAKIYRVGILMYGKKPTFKDIIKWFRLAS
ncbi:MAG TPA: ABC transporter permease [Candidatus Kapabacteria bacterium]|nr:ABC transporter permease [Candidatus Kapabacteria bacterium]